MNFEDINIVYEDNHLLVIVKPQNIPVCPDSSGDDNLLDLLKEYIKVSENKPGAAFLGLVHRLDRPTGGVMVFAKTSKAAARLFKSMEENNFEKHYLAVVDGVPRQSKSILKDALYKDKNKNIVYCVPIATEGATMAVLEYEVIEKRDVLSLLKINLITGRSHQARVQLSNIGTPIFADSKYGKFQKGSNLALWAYSLKFPHPVTKEVMFFIVYPPTDESPWRIFDLTKHISVL